MKSSDLTIQGMSCQHCVAAVKKELLNIPLLTLEDVQVGKASVTYDETKVDESTLRTAIANAGYILIAIQ
jgi:copper chaperone